jgi:hypothetical protein
LTTETNFDGALGVKEEPVEKGIWDILIYLLGITIDGFKI